MIRLRPYQYEAWNNKGAGVEIWLWGRQLGKSFTLAAWAVDQVVRSPGRDVFILSNSRDNGAELNRKVGEICRAVRQAFEEEAGAVPSVDGQFESMRHETRIRVNGKVSRIKVLAANPRTARGFSGDLILDEFAFQEDAKAIWEAAEPILASNPDFRCRIASTPNGTHNLFYRMVQSGRYPVRRMTRTEAWKAGVAIHDPITRESITPEVARMKAIDKRAYDQNYECVFADETMSLLSYELISAAECQGDGRGTVVGGVYDQNWPKSVLEQCVQPGGELYMGVDVGRCHDLSVVTLLERHGERFQVLAMLRMDNMRLPEQEERIAAVCRHGTVRRVCIDMSGLGLGLFEYVQRQFGARLVQGIHFSTTVPITKGMQLEGQPRERVRVTEAMALETLRVFEERRIRIPCDDRLREDLRKPGRVTTPGGLVSIAASRDDAGHADHFWSVALAIEAAATGGPAPAFESIKIQRHARPLQF